MPMHSPNSTRVMPCSNSICSTSEAGVAAVPGPDPPENRLELRDPTGDKKFELELELELELEVVGERAWINS